MIKSLSEMIALLTVIKGLELGWPIMNDLIASSASLTIAENTLATSIGIPAPTDNSYSSSALMVTVTGLPSEGTVLLADGLTPVTLGETVVSSTAYRTEIQAHAQ